MFQEYGGYGTPDMMGGYGELAFTGMGWLALIGKMAWDKWFSKESKSTAELVMQLTERLRVQEEGLKRLEKELDLERRLRRLEQNKVHSLVLYIIELKNELRRHNIEVPASTNLLYEDKELAELLGVANHVDDPEIDSSDS